MVKDVLLASISSHYGAETESHKSKEIILLGECGWANWPQLVCVWEPLLSKAEEQGPMVKVGRPRQDTLWPPPCLWHTLHWIICLPNATDSAGSVVNSRGAARQLAFLCLCGFMNNT